VSELRNYVVLVEDGEADAFMVREAFRQHQIDGRLDVIADGEKAVEFVEMLDTQESHPCPQLYLLDLNLPKFSGDVVLQQIRKSRRCGQVPVIILTSSRFPRDEAELMQLGATCYFQKPSRLDEFLRLGGVVRELLAPAK
jgi:DNA-binding response OmpR family regulator